MSDQTCDNNQLNLKALNQNKMSRDEIKLQRAKKKTSKQSQKNKKLLGDISGGTEDTTSKPHDVMHEDLQKISKIAPESINSQIFIDSYERTQTCNSKNPKLSHLEGDNKYKAKLFNHLNSHIESRTIFMNSVLIHPSIVRTGQQYLNRSVTGSNARCIAFLFAIIQLTKDRISSTDQEISRDHEANSKKCTDYLQHFRPLAVSVINASKYIKYILTQLPRNSLEVELKENIIELLEDYINDQIDKAAEAISSTVQEKICNDDVILTFGCSPLANRILEEAHRRKVNFRVIIVDSRQFLDGQELLRRLTTKGIPCCCVSINAVSFIMPEVTKVLLGAHALLANGYVMARAGTAQIALVAHSLNVPTLICCETHKFSERVQTDAIVFNELGNPDNVFPVGAKGINKPMKRESFENIYPLNLIYDITPPELVNAVITEVAILPCTSVPVILRIRPMDAIY